MKIEDLTYIKDSQIHGKGLFARSPIVKNTVIGELKGQKTDQNGPYVLWINEQEGLEVEGPLKYINHADEPNACYYDDYTVVALRDISIDEEITHNYGSHWAEESE